MDFEWLSNCPMEDFDDGKPSMGSSAILAAF